MKKLFSYGGKHLRRQRPAEHFPSALSFVLLVAVLIFGTMSLKEFLQMCRGQRAFDGSSSITILSAPRQI